MFKPTAMEQYISTLPENLQVLALKAVKEEHDRWERGDLTEDEKAQQVIVKHLGTGMASPMEKMAARIFNG